MVNDSQENTILHPKKPLKPMRRRQKRAMFLGFVVPVTALAVTLTLVALRKTTVYFYAPNELPAITELQGKTIRLGGLVLEGSIQQGADAIVTFAVTDRVRTIRVYYKGILPGLFAEGQSVVVQGTLVGPDQFQAARVLAKHDENYMPAEVAEALEEAKATTE